MYKTNFYISSIYEYDFKVFVLSLSQYEYNWREIVLFLKHSVNTDSEILLDVIADILYKNFLLICENFLKIENKNILITYIPSSWKRRLKGKNNNYFLAEKFFHLLKREINEIIFSKIIEFKFFTKSQTNKNAEDRVLNRKNSIIVIKENMPVFDNKNSSIYIVIEDVITTGSTVRAFLEEIKSNIHNDDIVIVMSIANITL